MTGRDHWAVSEPLIPGPAPIDDDVLEVLGQPVMPH